MREKNATTGGQRWSLSRRSMLRAAGVGIALPVLEMMCNSHGTAYANGTPFPTVFGLFTWGNGVRPETWIPATTGAGSSWALSRSLAPLAPVKEALNVVTGTSIALTDFQHPQGAANIYTGTNYSPTDTRRYSEATPQGPSIDQVVAQAFGSTTPLRSLHLAIATEIEKGEGVISQTVSHNGPNSPNLPTFNPQEAFDRLFPRVGPSPMGPAPIDPRVKYRGSVLDAVKTDIQRLQGQVGTADRARLDQHFTAVRELERVFARTASDAGAPSPATCATPARPAAAMSLEDVNGAMARVLALALACGQTRVFTYQLAGTRDYHDWAVAGVPGNYHSITHGNGPGPFEQVTKVVTYIQRQFATLLGELKQLPIGAGTLLDQCCILATSEVATGVNHQGIDWPILIAGRAGTALKSDQHLRLTGTNTMSVHLTLLRALGLNVPSYGRGSHLFVTQTIGGFWHERSAFRQPGFDGGGARAFRRSVPRRHQFGG
jgi:hypothetical protein